MCEATFTKERLFEFLIIDDIQVENPIINKAMNDDGCSLSKIASMYYDRQDYTKAINWYLLSAAQGYRHAQHRLGYMYEEGESVPVDYKLAMEWYLKAHRNGSISATNNIGFLYEKGHGVPRDDNSALKWYLEAANKGNACAQSNVGGYFEFGRSVKMDKRYALNWYCKSVEGGFEKAKRGINRLNKKGIYIDKK